MPEATCHAIPMQHVSKIHVAGSFFSIDGQHHFRKGRQMAKAMKNSSTKHIRKAAKASVLRYVDTAVMQKTGSRDKPPSHDAFERRYRASKKSFLIWHWV